VQNGAQNGNIDVIVGIYHTYDRAQYLAYPNLPYIEDVNVVWVLKGREFPFEEWGDLVGKRGTAMLGESYGEEFDHFINERLNIERVSTPLQNLKKLAALRSDYYPFSLHGGKIQVRQFGFGERVHHLPHSISKEGVYIAISKKSRYARHLQQLTAAIRQYSTDGTIERLETKYLDLAADER
jgi:polar amino acid transport system substrate-binding protein